MPRQDSPLVKSCPNVSLKRKLKRKGPLLKLKKRKAVKPLTQVYSSDGSQSPVFSKKILACPIPANTSPDILRGDREQSFVLQELQPGNLSPPETNPGVKSYFQATSNLNEVKSLKNLDGWLSKENQFESATTDQVEHKAVLRVKNSVCAASSPGLDYHELDDWNVSAIPSRLPSESDFGEDSLLKQQKTKAFFPPSPKDNLQIKTYEKKKVFIRKPFKVDTDHITKDPYQFSSDSDSDFITKNPRNHFSYLTSKPSRSGQLSCTPPEVPCSRNQSTGSRSESPARNRMTAENDGSVILITDDDESGLETRRKKKLKADSSTPVLVNYKHITITTVDYQTLEEGEFLNDNIIEFFLTHLKEEVLNLEERDKVHMFSTHFYGALTKPKKGVDFEKDRSLTEAQRQYKRVERWTKNINLFEKDMVIFPICVEAHWLLIIAIKPGLIKCPPKSEERTIKGEPFLILLDSMGGDNEKLVAKIRQYLTEEWKVKTGGKETFGKREVRLVKPEKPEQLNFTDCGVYLLQYIEKMFKSVAQFYWFKLPDLTDWFPLELILRKRHEMAQHIQNMARVQLQDSCPKFPEIRLNTEDDINLKAKKSKRRKAKLNYDEDFQDLLFNDDKLEKRKTSLRRKKSPERHNTRPKRKLLPVDKSGAEESPDSGQETNDQFGDPLLSMKQKLAQTYKIPRRKGGANLNEDQILDALDKQEPKESLEPGATRGKKRSKRKEEMKSEKNVVQNSEESAEIVEKNTVIDPSTREMLPPGEVPDLERTKFKQFLDLHKPADRPADKPADKPADRPTDKPADTERTEKEGFNQYMDNKKSRKSERALSDVKEYNSAKYKDSRENSPTKAKGESNLKSMKKDWKEELDSKQKKAKEDLKKEPNDVVGKEAKEGQVLRKEGQVLRKEVASKLKKKKKDKSSFIDILKNDWESDASSECSPSRKKKYIPSLNMPTIEPSPSPPLYPTPSNPSSKTRLTSSYSSTNSLSRLKKRSHQHIIKHKNVDAKMSMSRAPRGNPGKLFTAVVIPQVTTTAATPPRNGGNLVSNCAGGNQLPKFPMMAPNDKQMRLFSARSSCSDQHSNDSSYGDI